MTSTVSEHVGTIGRGGVVIAMSSGLVATMGLPAQAVPDRAPAARSGAKTATSTTTTQTAPLTASATAKVSFDKGSAFKAMRATADVSRREARAQAAARAARSTSSRTTAVEGGSVRGSAVLAVAARYLGSPYVPGGESPSPGFDCSGYTQYVFSQLGKNLPRTANQQMGASRIISRSAAQPGDLVFFVSGGRAYHVGIYAGGNMIYDAGSSGGSVRHRAIWSATVVFGQVL